MKRTHVTWIKPRPMQSLAMGLMVLAGWSLPVLGQDKSAPVKGAAVAAALPTGEKLMDDYVEAIGGSKALEKFQTRRSEGTFEMKAVGLSGTMELLQSEPNKMLVKIDLPGIGKIENGFDGDTAWENSAISGARVLEGEEKNQLARRALFAADSQWRKVYETATTRGEDKIGDRAVWVVELKPIGSDKPQTNYFDKETKLLLKLKMTAVSPMGDIAVDTDISDYREVDGIKLPFVTQQSVLGQTQTMTITKVVHDEKLDNAIFSPKAKKPSGSK